eukprot:g81676.t1
MYVENIRRIINAGILLRNELDIKVTALEYCVQRMDPLGYSPAQEEAGRGRLHMSATRSGRESPTEATEATEDESLLTPTLSRYAFKFPGTPGHAPGTPGHAQEEAVSTWLGAAVSPLKEDDKEGGAVSATAGARGTSNRRDSLVMMSAEASPRESSQLISPSQHLSQGLSPSKLSQTHLSAITRRVSLVGPSRESSPSPAQLPIRTSESSEIMSAVRVPFPSLYKPVDNLISQSTKGGTHEQEAYEQEAHEQEAYEQEAHEQEEEDEESAAEQGIQDSAAVVVPLRWFDAVKNGEVQEVVSLARGGSALVNAVDRRENTALMWACAKGHNTIGAFLVESKANLNLVNYHGNTALTIAARELHTELGKLLVNAKADIHIKNNYGDTALTLSASKGDTELASLLLAQKADVNTADEDGSTPLIWASKSGHADVAKLLLQQGAAVNATSMDGDSALLFAISGGYAEVGRLLILEKADVHAQNEDGDTAIVLAAEKGIPEVVDLLIKHQADVNAQDHEGHRALLWSALQGQQEVTRLLLQGKADVNVKGEDGATPLICAAKHGHAEVGHLLILARADIAIRDAYGNTALLAAAACRPNSHNLDGNEENKGKAVMDSSAGRRTHRRSSGQEHRRGSLGPPADEQSHVWDENSIRLVKAEQADTRLGKLLMDEKADVNCKDNDGNSALHKALVTSVDFTEMLLLAAADPCQPNSKGITVLQLILDTKRWRSNETPRLARAAATAQDRLCQVLNYPSPLHYMASLNDTQVGRVTSGRAIAVSVCEAWKGELDRDLLDDQGLTAREALLQSKCACVQKWVRAQGAFLGRFVRQLAPAYESESTQVWIAEDLEAPSQNQKVALKIKTGERAREEFGREVAAFEAFAHLSDESLQGVLAPLLYKDETAAVLALPLAESSLREYLQRHPLTTRGVSAVRDIARDVVLCLQVLHSCGMVHGDAEPGNVLLVDGRWRLLDFEASAQVEGMLDADKCRLAYAAPELAWSLGMLPHAQGLKATTALDIWSLGVLLYELCAGRLLFPALANDCQRTESASKLAFRQLCMWLSLPEEKAQHIFAQGVLDSREPEKVRRDATDLIVWCLQSDPSLRPSVRQVLEHPFLRMEAEMKTQTEEQPLEEERRSVGRVHFLLSYVPNEGSEQAEELCRKFEAVGASVALSGRVGDVLAKSKEQASRQRVADCAVFLLYLTNTSLNDEVCLQELCWAVELAKPILLLQEVDARFPCYDFIRWTQDRLHTESDGRYVASPWHTGSYRRLDDKYCSAVSEVKRQWNAQELIPFRRRDFEGKAMMREIGRRIGAAGCLWAARWGFLEPPNQGGPLQKATASSSLPEKSTDLSSTAEARGWPRLFCIAADACRHAASELAQGLQQHHAGLTIQLAPQPQSKISGVVSGGALPEAAVPESLRAAEFVLVLLPFLQDEAARWQTRWALSHRKQLLALTGAVKLASPSPVPQGPSAVEEDAVDVVSDPESQRYEVCVLASGGQVLPYRAKHPREYEFTALCEEVVGRVSAIALQPQRGLSSEQVDQWLQDPGAGAAAGQSSPPMHGVAVDSLAKEKLLGVAEEELTQDATLRELARLKAEIAKQKLQEASLRQELEMLKDDAGKQKQVSMEQKQASLEQAGTAAPPSAASAIADVSGHAAVTSSIAGGITSDGHSHEGRARSQSRQGTEANREFFFLSVVAVRLRYGLTAAGGNVKSEALFEKAIQSKVPFFLFHDWIKEQLTSHLLQSEQKGESPRHRRLQTVDSPASRGLSQIDDGGSPSPVTSAALSRSHRRARFLERLHLSSPQRSRSVSTVAHDASPSHLPLTVTRFGSYSRVLPLTGSPITQTKETADF